VDARSFPSHAARSPLVGWRVWWLHEGRLLSWNLNYVWPAGQVEAQCQAGRLLDPPLPPRHTAPGEGCGCGIWALWRLSACLNKARGERLLMAPGYFPVIGIISAWGEVALHGDEGFRAQFARVTCLLSEPIWDTAFDRYSSIGSRATRLLGRLLPGPGRRPGVLAQAATRYGVPVVSLQRALDIGLLSELGAQIA
jgi:hypothetical protein